MFTRLISILAWILPVCSAAPLPDPPSAEPLRLYGSLEATPDHLGIERDAGLRVGVVAVSWDRFEPRPGVYNEAYIKTLAVKKGQLRKLGYKLQLDFGVQYPPAWVFEAPQGRYRNQFGDIFVSRQSGQDLPNVVFNAEIRKDIDAYIGKIFATMGNDWDFVRLGCAKYGELNYPQARYAGHDNCYWAFDDLAQGKAPGLPDGMVPCPVPGWIPGVSSPEHGAAKRFIEWYLECLNNYQQWQIATVRRSYAGDICMLYGSWGLRPGWREKAVEGDLDGSISCERNGELEQGADWTRMIGSIGDPRVIVYCTWVDGTIRNRDIADDDNSDPSRWSPVHWQATLARSNPLHLRIWGENTGHNNSAAMRITFERIRRFDLMGVMWAFDSELFANPNSEGYATFADYSESILADSQRPVQK